MLGGGLRVRDPDVGFETGVGFEASTGVRDGCRVQSEREVRGGCGVRGGCRIRGGYGVRGGWRGRVGREVGVRDDQEWTGTGKVSEEQSTWTREGGGERNGTKGETSGRTERERRPGP